MLAFPHRLAAVLPFSRPSIMAAAARAALPPVTSYASYGQAALDYVINAVKGIAGPKVLLVDAEARNVITATVNYTQLLQHDVFLVALVDATDGGEDDGARTPAAAARAASRRNTALVFADAVVMIRPIESSILALCRELKKPRFKQYHLYFTNMVEPTSLQLILNADVQDVIQTVDEAYLDLCPVTEATALVPLSGDRGGAAPPVVVVTQPATQPAGSAAAPRPPVRNPVLSAIGHKRNPLRSEQWSQSDVTRCGQGLIALALSLKRIPCVRYRRSLPGRNVAERVATEVGRKLKDLKSIFFELSTSDTLLLVLDRLDDPVTPLLTPWTYEAMVHEVLGIDSHVVDLGEQHAREGGTRHEVLSAAHDTFFAQQRYASWDRVVVAVKQLVEAYKDLYGGAGSKRAGGGETSLVELRSTLEKLPEAKKQSAIMVRHMSLATLVSEDIRGRNLLDLSLAEQAIACSTDFSGHSKLVLELMTKPETEVEDALRLAILFLLKYESRGAEITALATQMREELQRRGLPAPQLALLNEMAQLFGSARRVGQLFEASSVLQSFKSVLATGLAGESSIDTQHKPQLQSIIDAAYNGQLSGTDYPFCSVAGTLPVPPPDVGFKEIIVFVVGGTTYEEAKLVHALNCGTIPNSASASRAGQVAAQMSSAMAGAVRAIANLGGGTSSDAAAGSSSSAAVASAAGAGVEPPRCLPVKVTLCSTSMLNTKSFLAALSDVAAA